MKDTTDIAFNHPHDHFRHRHIETIRSTCFVLMPFHENFTIVYQTIVEALNGIMICTRADECLDSALILEQILHEIRSAELIIADLTLLFPLSVSGKLPTFTKVV